MHDGFNHLSATALQKSDDALTPCFLNAIYANTAAPYAVKLANARC